MITVSRRALAVCLAALTALLPAALGAPASAVPGGQVAEFTAEDVNIRNAPRRDASINGVGYSNHSVTVWCHVFGDDLHHVTDKWYSLTDHTTGVSGYAWSGMVRVEGRDHTTANTRPC